MTWLIFHARTMTLNTFLARPAITNDVQRVGNTPLLASSYAVRYVSLQQLPPSTPTSVVLIWLLAILHNGERYASRLTIDMKLAVNNIVFGKTLNATYVLWRSSYPREKCGPRKKGRKYNFGGRILPVSLALSTLDRHATAHKAQFFCTQAVSLAEAVMVHSTRPIIQEGKAHEKEPSDGTTPETNQGGSAGEA